MYWRIMKGNIPVIRETGAGGEEIITHETSLTEQKSILKGNVINTTRESTVVITTEKLSSTSLT